MDTNVKQQYSDLIDTIVRQGDPSTAIAAVLAARLPDVVQTVGVNIDPTAPRVNLDPA